MTKPDIVVFEYGAGNVHSACHALEEMGASVTLTDDPQKVRAAQGVIVPGVGAFGYVVDRFRAHGGQQLLAEHLAAGKPLLGICVGMQILFQDAVEKGHHEGLGYLGGTVSQLPAARLPHMGWGKVAVPTDSVMFQGIAEEYFYFVHSYARLAGARPVENLLAPADPVLSTTATHGSAFVAAVESGPLWATQFHPEKSGVAGLRLLSNWLDTVRHSKGSSC